jgi:SAM-dependent methyltransferase
MFDTYEEIFAARAESYQQAMEALPRARDREFMAVVEPLGDIAGKILCDMPAGGAYLRRHLPQDVHYIAVEPSEIFIAHCPTAPGCSAVRGPIERVPLDTGSTDCLVSLAGLHHCPDLVAVFREMRRLVRDGGTIVIADVEQGTRPALFLNGYVDAHNPLGHRGTFLDDAIPLLLRDAGLVPVEDALIEIPWSFDNARQAGAYCGALFGIEGVSADGIGAAMEAMLGLCRGPGTYNLRWELRRLICSAG